MTIRRAKKKKIRWVDLSLLVIALYGILYTFMTSGYSISGVQHLIKQF